jgi:hypothetical protein
MRVASTQWRTHFFNRITVESGIRDELRDRGRLGSLGGVVRINGITAVLKFVSSADTPAAAGVTDCSYELLVYSSALSRISSFAARTHVPVSTARTSMNFGAVGSNIEYACWRACGRRHHPQSWGLGACISTMRQLVRTPLPGYFQELSPCLAFCTRCSNGCCSKKMIPYCSWSCSSCLVVSCRVVVVRPASGNVIWSP